MSSLNASVITAEVAYINLISVTFFKIWSYMLFGLGLVGHSLSIYVFTRPPLRSNSCTRYFMAATISGFCVVFLNVPLRLLQTGYGINLFIYSLASCKTLTFILFWTRAQTPWIIVLCSVDRFLCSSQSAAVRAWSSLRVATCSTLLSIPLVGIAYVHVAIYYQYGPRQLTCIAMPGFYQTFIGIWNLIVFSLGPTICMLIFGLLTIRHTRHMVRRAEPQIIQINVRSQPQSQGQLYSQAQSQTQSKSKSQSQIQPRKSRKNKDRQLIQMMLIQCAVFIFTSTPISVNYLYTAARTNMTVDAVQVAKDNMFNQMTGLISITAQCTSFYTFTLSSQLFRRQIMVLFSGTRCLKQQKTNSISLN